MVFLVDWNKVQKFTNAMLVIGILCVAVAGPVLNQALSAWPSVPETEMNIPDTSQTNITQAYTFRHTVLSDNQVSLRIQVTGQDSRVYVRIYQAVTFTTLTAPTSTSLQSMVYSVPQFPNTPSGTSTTTFDSNNGRVANIDFGGATSGSTIVYIPGDYVIVVYGDNTTGTGNVRFKLQITTEVVGRVWGRIVNTVGWILVISCGILSMLFWIKKTLEVGR
ncbi:MAG: hypothetical protein JW839_16835 [Candidatus Lokiarchaeota archaeon]|nr:hypothetical protein [Candidatus Lokiarchaeota archaeon]